MKKRFISGIIAICIVFLTQGCMVHIYSKQGTDSIEQLTDQKGRVKVTTIDGQEFKFKSIETLEDQYYGEGVIRGRNRKVLIPRDRISKIYPEDRSKSAFMSALLLTGLMLAVIPIVILANGSNPI